jgi:outer membrane protein OmpA-like peptidoglycan-associated protein
MEPTAINKKTVSYIMKKTIWNTLLITFLLPDFLFSQITNLVPNSSFEQYTGLPKGPGEAGRLVGWKLPITNGGTDYYHMDARSDKVRIPKNGFGYQHAHSGRAYAGICVSKKYREYLQVDLLKPLEKGKQYKIQVFISCGDRFGLSAVKEFNVIFTQKKLYIPENEYISTVPKVVFRSKRKYKNKKEWTELSMIYTADGMEKVMTFGCFLYQNKSLLAEDNRPHGNIFGLSKYAHYYIDDFSIIPLVPDSDVITAPPVEPAETKKKESALTMEFKIGNTYILNNIQFETGKSELLPQAFPELDKLVLYLQKNATTKLKITGHTDNNGDPEANLKLSQERAKMVLLYVASKGIHKDRMTTEGKGDTQPIASNDTEAGREKNRRVEISFLF